MWLLSFLSFFLVSSSYQFRFERLHYHSPEGFLTLSFCSTGLSVITNGSPDVCFVLVLPSCVIYPPFPVISKQAFPAGVPGSVFVVGCSEFLLRTSVSYGGCWVRLFPSFVFLPSLGCFRELPLPFASVIPACPSFCFASLSIVTCSSPFSSLLSAHSLSLRCFECFPCVSFACVEFFSLVFLTLCQFSFSALFTYRTLSSSLACGCFLRSVPSASIFSGQVSLFILYSSVSLPMFHLLLLCHQFMRRFVGCFAFLSVLHVRRPF